MEKDDVEKYRKNYRENRCFSWYEFVSTSFSKEVVKRSMRNLDG